MQQIFVEKPYRFVPPLRTTFWSTVFRHINLHGMFLARAEKVTSHELRGVEHLKGSLAAGHGIMLAPNHSRTADPIAMGWIATAAKCHCYGMASWHLFQSPVQAWLLRSLGAFGVNREGVDRAAVAMSIETLTVAKRPLIMFPEGVTSRTNDRLGPLLDGVAFIARTAAKRRAKATPAGKVVVHPVAIKYLYQGDAEGAIDETLSGMEQRLSWPPQQHNSLKRRILKVAEALLALKEIEFFGAPKSGSLFERADRLVSRLVHRHEEAILGSVQEGPAVHRIKALRVRLMGDLTEGKLAEAERKRRWKILSELYLAQQIDAYPHDYLDGKPTVDRMLEIVEKFEEDFTDLPRPHGPLKAILEVGEAIEVKPQRERQAAADPLMATLREQMQEMLTKLGRESPSYTQRRKVS